MTLHLYATSKTPQPEGPRLNMCAVHVVTLLRITLRIQDDEEQTQETTTWCTGLTEKDALSRWRRECPTMAGDYLRHEVVTPRAATGTEPWKESRARVKGAA